MFCLQVYLLITCVFGPCGGQKKASDPLKQELQSATMQVLGIDKVLCKGSKYS